MYTTDVYPNGQVTKFVRVGFWGVCKRLFRSPTAEWGVDMEYHRWMMSVSTYSMIQYRQVEALDRAGYYLKYLDHVYL